MGPLVPVPDELPSRTAAAVLLQGMTAHAMTHDVHQGSAGEWALVHAAAGGTGSLLVQFLIQQGVKVLASTSSERKAEYLRGIGVEHVINFRPAIAESLPLRHAARAHQLLEARAVIGKVLLEV